jgi:CBS domain-containing protein
LRKKGIGALVVSDNYVEVQGMISERGITLGLAEHGVRLLTMTVADVMQKGIIRTPDDDLGLVMARMTTRRVRRWRPLWRCLDR